MTFNRQQLYQLKRTLREQFTRANRKRLLLLAIPTLVLLLIIFSILKLLSNTPDNTQPTSTSTQVAKPLATVQINKEFTFSLKDTNGKQVGSFKYKILSAELDKQIIIKGERATAVDGREFLIINLQLTNASAQDIQVNTRDYVRLAINGMQEPLAPEIHNDPVETQAISTEFTRVGFPIDQSSKHLVLQVGEITGTKTDIKLNL
jgi:hypothetical protein